MDHDETYLGDGLYFSFDGYQIRLRAPRSFEVDEVFLEPRTFAELLRIMKDRGVYKGLLP